MLGAPADGMIARMAERIIAACDGASKGNPGPPAGPGSSPTARGPRPVGGRGRWAPPPTTSPNSPRSNGCWRPRTRTADRDPDGLPVRDEGGHHLAARLEAQRVEDRGGQARRQPGTRRPHRRTAGRAAPWSSATCPPTRWTATRSTTSPTGPRARRRSSRRRPAASGSRSRRPPRYRPAFRSSPRRLRRGGENGVLAGRARGVRRAPSTPSSPDAAAADAPTRRASPSPRTRRAGASRLPLRRGRRLSSFDEGSRATRSGRVRGPGPAAGLPPDEP